MPRQAGSQILNISHCQGVPILSFTSDFYFFCTTGLSDLSQTSVRKESFNLCSCGSVQTLLACEICWCLKRLKFNTRLRDTLFLNCCAKNELKCLRGQEFLHIMCPQLKQPTPICLCLLLRAISAQLREQQYWPNISLIMSMWPNNRKTPTGKQPGNAEKTPRVFC